MLRWRVRANRSKRFSIRALVCRLGLRRRLTVARATAHTEFGTVWILMAALGTEHSLPPQDSLQKEPTVRNKAFYEGMWLASAR